MHKTWTSRKFILSVIAAIFTAAATMGFDVPIKEVVVTDAVVAVWVLAEAVLDAVKR